ncbi:PREDICTED: uncharacterized protein LOC104784231 [Camelina sativa]|uniref:Uncharacterized protein LOC104784231 n=1 Tax=Camelina sativa TaxID=90675 RepID=A0ABM1RL71_CAMSA|nr:PREDICTED: uncharacterized protein LOC104784231 [Camelina sativa]
MALVPVVNPPIGVEFDEEGEDRDEFHIDKLATDFTETEESIRHNVYPESDDESEGNGRGGAARGGTPIVRGDGIMYKGQRFYNGIAFKECVTDYALATGCNLKQYRYDRDRIGFRCVGAKGKCQWKVYAASLHNESMWRITKYTNTHVCGPNGDCEMFKVPVIARLFLDKIREEPDYYMPLKMEQTIMEKWKISATRGQCQAARRKALAWIASEYDTQFERLRDYGAEILEANQGSVVEIDTVKNDAGHDVFKRFYVCFDVLRKTWKKTCRPLIGVDGCFLKEKIKGQLLVALGRDADNAIYPIAWSVVQVENTDNWSWFVNRLKIDLELGDGDGYIMVSDRQKGLIKAVELELPKIEHRKCVRHIYGNLKKTHPDKKQLKKLLWDLAWSYNTRDYEERLERIHAYDSKVYEDVMKTKPKTWCRAFHKIGSYCEDVENNSVESFNNTINKAREKPFVAMLETVRRLAMVRIAKRSAISYSHEGLCTPYVTRFLADEHKAASTCFVSPSTNGAYEVYLGYDKHRVCLNARTCTCMKFQICGIPCEHAYGLMIKKTLVAEDYVCEWFRTAKWRQNYTDGLVPQRGPRFWPSTGGENVYPPPKPDDEKIDKKRKKGVNESPTKKQPKQKKRIMHCGICGAADHNWWNSSGIFSRLSHSREVMWDGGLA